MQRPECLQAPSLNYTPHEPGRKVSCIVIHATATKEIKSPLAYLRDRTSKVSAHYLIDTTGAVYNLVNEKDIAWHAGKYAWRNLTNANRFSIGIELVNLNDGKMPYPAEQVDSCARLCIAICDEYKIDSDDIVGHFHISPGRKTDPVGFDFASFRNRIERRIL